MTDAPLRLSDPRQIIEIRKQSLRGGIENFKRLRKKAEKDLEFANSAIMELKTELFDIISNEEELEMFLTEVAR